MQLFGYELKKSAKHAAEEMAVQPIAPPEEVVAESDAVISGGRFGTPYEIDASRDTEGQLINRYRSMLIHQEVDDAVTDICNEAIVYNDDRKPYQWTLSDLRIDESVKSKITSEFEKILTMLDFASEGHNLFKRWYVDGRIAYHISIDKDAPEKGILDMRKLDPRRLKKLTKITEEEDKETKAKFIKKVESVYTYDQSVQMKNGSSVSASPTLPGATMGSVILPNDTVVHVTSGMFDSKHNRIIGHLHKAIRPVTN